MAKGRGRCAADVTDRGAAKIQSKEATGAGFASGIETIVSPSKAAAKLPPNIKARVGEVIKPRPGVWHPNATKP